MINFGSPVYNSHIDLRVVPYALRVKDFYKLSTNIDGEIILLVNETIKVKRINGIEYGLCPIINRRIVYKTLLRQCSLEDNYSR